MSRKSPHLLSIILIIVSLLLSLTSSHTISTAKHSPYISHIRDYLSKDSGLSWAEKHDALLTLLKLNEPLDSYKSQCQNLASLTENDSLADVYHAVAVDVALKCPNSKQFDQIVEKSVEKFWAKVSKDNSAASMEEYYHFARILILKADVFKGFVTKHLSELKKVFAHLSKLDLPNIADASYQIEAITTLAKKLGGPKVDTIFDTLFAASKYVAQVAHQINPNTPLKDAALFARAANKLASMSKITSKFPKQVNEIMAKILLNTNLTEAAHDPKNFIQNAFNQVDAIRALESSPIYTPVLVSDVRLDLEKNRLIVDARDISGNIPKDLKLKRAYSVANSKTYILEDEKMKQENDHLVVDFHKDKNAVESFGAKVGEFIFEFASKDDYVVKRSVKFTTNIEVQSFSMLIYEKSQYPQVISRQPVQFPNEMPHITVETAQQFLEVLVTLGMKDSAKPVSPQQVFVHVYPHFDSAFARGRTFKLKQTQLGTYSLKLDLSKDDAEFRPIDGDYAVELIVGDSFLTQPIQWNVGQIRLTFEKQYEPTEEEKRWAVRPEIVHIFQPSEKRSHGVVSLIFSALAVVPLVGFVLYLLKITGAKNMFDQLPSSPSYFFANIALQACIVAMVGVLILYFFSWRILRVVKCLLALAILAGFIGAYALRGVSQRRIANKAAAAKQ